MAIGPDRTYQARVQTTAAEIDVGLREYMLRVYNYMVGGLAVTGLVAYFVSSSPALLQAIYGTPLQWVVMLAPLGFVLFFVTLVLNIIALHVVRRYREQYD